MDAGQDSPLSVTRQELAKSLNVSLRTVERWNAQGCPRTRDGRKLVYALADVRAWLGESVTTTETVAPPPQSQRSRLGLAKHALEVEQRKRDLEAERGLASLGLDARIRSARTLDDVARLAQEVGALVASGELSTVRAASIKSLLGELRQARTAHLRHHPPASSVAEIQLGEARRKTALASRYETELGALQGSLVSLEEVRTVFAEQVALVKAAFESLPDRIQGLTRDQIVEELDRVLHGFATGMRK